LRELPEGHRFKRKYLEATRNILADVPTLP